MLDVLRENFKKTPYLKIVLLLVALTLVFYLGSYFFDSSGSPAAAEWAARVNGTEIPARDFVTAARNIDQYYRNLFGQNYDQIRSNLQISQQAIQQLIDQELILQDARRLGLRSSKQELAEQIRSTPGFQDAEGQFIGAERYREIVDRSVPGGVTAYERDLSNGILAQRWANLVTQPVVVADDELRKLFRQRTEKTKVNFVIVPSSGQKIDENVDETQLQAWYDGHSDDYRRQEARRIRFLVVDRDAQEATVAAEEIQAFYDANTSRYSFPEQRRARHILFRAEPDASEEDRLKLRERAEQTLARLAAGEDFAELATELSDDTMSAAQGGDLGFFGRGAMVAEFEEPAFSTPVGTLAPITESPFGVHVIEVLEARDAGVTPLGEVEESIRLELEIQAKQSGVAAEAERLREALEAGEALESIAAREGLEVQSETLAAGDRLPDLGASPDFLSTVATLEVGAMSRPLQVAAGLALVTVEEVLPPAVPPLDEVRDDVRADLLAGRREAEATRAAERALTGNADMEKVAKALDLTLSESDAMPPGQAPPGVGGNTPELQEKLFGDEATLGGRGVVPVPAGALVYEITEREGFDPERFDTQRGDLRQEILGQKRQQYRQVLLNQIRQEQTIEFNQALLSRYSNS